ncbi:MAG: hypothetical protein AB1762_09970 [Gemmatimonadota bacterium]
MFGRTPHPATQDLYRTALAVAFLAVTPALLLAQRYRVRGEVRDAQTEGALVGVRIHSEWDDIIGVPHPPVATDSAGGFALLLDRRGPLVLLLRHLGYQPQRVTVDMAADSTEVLVRLVRTTQQLPTVTVTETAVSLFVDSLRTEMRRIDHLRFFDTGALERSKQILAGAFLFGQAGMKAVPCGRSSLFLPKGTARTVPVENEPADIWFPCVLVRDKPQSVMVRIDGGEPQPFATISQRQLAEFAAIGVIGGRLILAYTKGYATTHAPKK